MGIQAQCPACATESARDFYFVPTIPVNSAVLVDDQQAALEFPTGDLRLSFCATCGFIWNRVFDWEVLNYDSKYEETQGFSGTFNSFTRTLAVELVGKYSLQGKKALEIGCGKGEFISLLCELGVKEGIGIDPTFVPGRLQGAGTDRVHFINDFYGTHSAHLEADFICCRHTLEHIPDPRHFLETLRKNIGNRKETVVFFEVPDTLRILQEPSFWDVYYEHCSYFSAGSLARLFRQCGFQILELRRAFADQYLLIVASPTSVPAPEHMDLEMDLSVLDESVSRFSQEAMTSREKWRHDLDAAFAAGRKTALWGSGSKAAGFLTTLKLDKEIGLVVDINPHKRGKFQPGSGQRIAAPEELSTFRPDQVIIMNPVYLKEINATLLNLGLSPEVRCV